MKPKDQIEIMKSIRIPMPKVSGPIHNKNKKKEKLDKLRKKEME